MNGVSRGDAVPLTDSADRAARFAAESQLTEGSALHRLAASRALILAAMGARVRESAPPAEEPRNAPKPLRVQLLELAGQLPIVRTALAICGLWRG